MTLYFDPFNRDHTAGRTHDEIDRCLRESTAAMIAAANDPDRPRKPLTQADLDTDADTRTIGGKSRGALRSERRPHRVKRQDGGVSYNGGKTWEADGAA